jgi:hypothetical protein
MNRLEPADRCRVCGMNIRARLLATTLIRLRAEFARMIDNGMCDNCQSDRLEAALEFENSAAEIRLAVYLGAGWSQAKPPVLHPALQQAMRRRNRADAWCVRLKMWPKPAREERP